MIDVLRYRYITAAISVSIFASFIGYYIYLRQTRGYAYTYSVDFEGGTQIRVKLDKPTTTTQIRAALEQGGWQNASTRQFSSQEFLIRVKDVSSDVKVIAERIQQTLVTHIQGLAVEVLESELITPAAVQILRFNSIMAIILALIAMLLYTAVRFWSFAFGLGTLVSLFHDAVVVLAVFLFLDREVSGSLIVAIMTLLGYSLNDTIVIFSTIREKIAENERLKRVVPLAQVVTYSINKTLRRTILISFAVTLVVIPMLLFGGESMRDLSLALLVGIIFGTYSSIYIASPVMMMFYKEKQEPRTPLHEGRQRAHF